MFIASQVTSEAEEAEAAWEAGGLEGYRRLLERKRDEWKNVPLNVAVIGNKGVGKSSFINAIRGLRADDEGAAAVGRHHRNYDENSRLPASRQPDVDFLGSTWSWNQSVS